MTGKFQLDGNFLMQTIHLTICPPSEQNLLSMRHWTFKIKHAPLNFIRFYCSLVLQIPLRRETHVSFLPTTQIWHFRDIVLKQTHVCESPSECRLTYGIVRTIKWQHERVAMFEKLNNTIDPTSAHAERSPANARIRSRAPSNMRYSLHALLVRPCYSTRWLPC